MTRQAEVFSKKVCNRFNLQDPKYSKFGDETCMEWMCKDRRVSLYLNGIGIVNWVTSWLEENELKIESGELLHTEDLGFLFGWLFENGR